jgi:CRISPR/Cas system-associated exonuclease Cas4 (RecB family)
MTDPRRKLPSASSFARYAACPGAFALEAQARETGELANEETPEALSGSRIHQAMAGEKVQLSGEESDIVAKCWQLEAAVLADEFGEEIKWCAMERERRIWCHDPRDLRPLFSGQFDLVARRDDKILIVDYKTGWGDVTAPERNWQLRALVALVAGEEGSLEHPPSITAALILPRQNPQIERVVYSGQDVLTAWDACIGLARIILSSGQPRIAGEQCRHCPVRELCPEARELVGKFSVLTVEERHADLMTADQLVWVLDRCGAVEEVIGKIRARAKRMLEGDPNSLPGWRLKPGVMRSTITHVAALWDRLHGQHPIQVTAEAFAGACSMTKTHLRELLRNSLGLKGRALDDATRESVEGLCEEKQTAPTLERVRE